MRKSESIKELAAALSKAQLKMGHAAKDASNPYFGSTYADLASVIDASREALADNGLSITQGPRRLDNSWVLVTTLMHTSGEWMESETPIISSKNDAQGFGSGMTYARRYSWSAIAGITQDDDDGNAAVDKPKAQAKPAAKPAQAPQKPAQAPQKPEAKKVSELPNHAPQAKPAANSGHNLATGNVKVTNKQLDFVYSFAKSKGFAEGEVTQLIADKYKKNPTDLTSSEAQMILAGMGYEKNN